MGRLINLFFQPPKIPPIAIPLPARIVPGIMSMIRDSIAFAYYRGVFDGMVAGVLLALLLAPSLRGRSCKGDCNGNEKAR